MELYFHHKASPFVRKALLGIIELGVDCVDRAIDFSSTEAMNEYALINPNRRFPALRDGELVLWESNAILRYLARRTPWLGQTDGAAALVEQWLCWELAHLGPTLLGLQNHRLGFLPRPPRDEATLSADKDRLLRILDQALEGRSYVVSHITIADLALAAVFSFAEEAELLDATYGHVCRWLDAMRARPSWQATERMKQETLAAFNIQLPMPRLKVPSTAV